MLSVAEPEDHLRKRRSFANHLDLRRDVATGFTDRGVELLIVLADLDLGASAGLAIPLLQAQLILARSGRDLKDTGRRHLHLALKWLLHATKVAPQEHRDR